VGRKFNISKNWLAVILLTAYSGVYLINLACNLEREIDLYAVEEASTTVHHHPDHSSSGHAHHSHGENHSHDKDAADDEAGDDGCCDDAAPIVYVSISNTTAPSASMLKIYLPSIQIIESAYKLLRFKSLYSYTRGYLNKAPRLKIPDIRILIQSFLI